mgnify:CR=1 FL=1
MPKGSLVPKDTRTTYDALGRVAQVWGIGFSITYSYDAVGNGTRIQSTYVDGSAMTQDLWYRYWDFGAGHRLEQFRTSTKDVAVRTSISLMLALIVVLSLSVGCSRDVPPPKRLADIPSRLESSVAGGVYLHVPGSILDSYMTLDITSTSGQYSPLSVAKCELLAARIDAGVLDVVIYHGEASLRSLRSSGEGGASDSSIVDLSVRNFDRSPSDEELGNLKASGYVLTKCDF